MKSMLYQAVEEAPAVESVEEEILKRHFANFDETFFNYCDKELKKINTFYSEVCAFYHHSVDSNREFHAETCRGHKKVRDTEQ
jgi:hypothetical protein